MKDIEKLDYLKIDNIVVSGVDHKDYPEYCDAYIESADYNGEPMTEEQLENLDSSFVYEKVYDSIF